MNKQAQEWAKFCALNPSAKSAFARKMRDPANRQAALRALGHGTAEEKRESRARQRAIAEVTPAEIRIHCQFERLSE